MARLPFVLVVAVALSAACGANTATQEPVPDTRVTAKEVAPEIATSAVLPENPADRGIRRNLNLAITQDASLKHRDISFIVTNGDVSVTGTVQSEEERRKINDLAMNIDGVKSVANALRVAE
jgi:osmotically-inducible protein OsmY